LRCTLPERKQRVHTYMRLGTPLISARTCWMLGFLVRFVAMFEWLRLLPWSDVLSQILHLFAISYTSSMELFAEQMLFYH
jgi:hypothetical protein